MPTTITDAQTTHFRAILTVVIRVWGTIGTFSEGKMSKSGTRFCYFTDIRKSHKSHPYTPKDHREHRRDSLLTDKDTFWPMAGSLYFAKNQPQAPPLPFVRCRSGPPESYRLSFLHKYTLTGC